MKIEDLDHEFTSLVASFATLEKGTPEYNQVLNDLTQYLEAKNATKELVPTGQLVDIMRAALRQCKSKRDRLGFVKAVGRGFFKGIKDAL